MRITHPEKILFPDSGITKAEVAAYYEAIVPPMVPHVRDRPVTMERYHRGIGEQGFFQKDVSKGFPDYPDLCIFDLDPAADDPAGVRRAALQLRDLLAELGLRSWVKTSGAKGSHIAVPLDRRATTDETAAFAHRVGRRLVDRDPAHLTQEFAKADRGGRILVDTGRHGYSATFAAPYAVRAKPGAPVSAPCTWEEVEAAWIRAPLPCGRWRIGLRWSVTCGVI